MKILFLTPWYPDEHNPYHGVFIRDQVRALAKCGDEIRVIVAKVDYSRFGVMSRQVTESVDNGIRVKFIRPARSFPLYNQVNFFLICLNETIKVLKDFNPDVIHGNIGYPGAFWSWLVSKKSGIPYVLTEHTLLHNNFRSPVHRWLTTAFVRRADKVITVSHHSAAVIKKLTGTEATVIPNLVDFSLFNSIHPFPFSPPIHIGLLGGSYFTKKGLDTLLQAISDLPDIILHIGGKDPSEQAHYEKLAADLGIGDRCKFYGAVVRQEVPAFMQRLHFFVSASVFESFGISIAEAMACGLPLVCTESGGPVDFVNSTSGILVPVGNVERLREAIKTLCNTYIGYDREKIRSEVLRRFDGGVIAGQIRNVYQQVLECTSGQVGT